VPLALADVDHLALAVDIAGCELDRFRDAQTCGIDGDEDRSHLEAAFGPDQLQHLLSGENRG